MKNVPEPVQREISSHHSGSYSPDCEISVVIPVYGCPAALPELHKRLSETLTKLTDSYEIILVNDCCPKGSWQVINEIANSDPHVIGLNLSRNFGQIKAITAGLDCARGKWTVVMDCDLQDRPEGIEILYKKAQEGYDTVLSRRISRKDKSGKILLSKAFYHLYSLLSDTDYDPSLSNFSIISSKVRTSYISMRELHRSYTIYIKWLGYKQTIVDMPHEARYEGESGYTLKKRIRMASDIITSSSDKLLRILFLTGCLMTGISGAGLLIALIAGIFQTRILWEAVFLTSLFLAAGFILIAVGIAGIYIGNIFMQVKNRPLYLVSERIETRKNNESEPESDNPGDQYASSIQ